MRSVARRAVNTLVVCVALVGCFTAFPEKRASCIAKTDSDLCSAASFACGAASVTDNCGAKRNLDCGTCAAGESCNDNRCGCTPQSDAAFCHGACGTLPGTDNCGAARNADCGACPIGQNCNANQCVCAETDAAFCARLNATCGALTAADACGFARTVATCGTCAYGACANNQCGPACGDLSFSAATPVTALDPVGGNSALEAFSPDGLTVLLTQASGGTCSTSNLPFLIADREQVADFFSPPQPVTLSGYPAQQLNFALLDRLTLIGIMSGGKTLATLTRNATTSTTFTAGPNGWFTTLNALLSGNSGTFYAPVISADGLSFYYQIGSSGAAGLDGVYESVRGSVDDAFPAGTLLTNVFVVSAGDANPSGISGDKLTLFTWGGLLGAVIFTRASVLDAFANPNFPSAPPAVAGYGAIPTADCQTLLTMVSPGGCPGQQINQVTQP